VVSRRLLLETLVMGEICRLLEGQDASQGPAQSGSRGCGYTVWLRHTAFAVNCRRRFCFMEKRLREKAFSLASAAKGVFGTPTSPGGREPPKTPGVPSRAARESARWCGRLYEAADQGASLSACRSFAGPALNCSDCQR